MYCDFRFSKNVECHDTRIVIGQYGNDHMVNMKMIFRSKETILGGFMSNHLIFHLEQIA